jgi:hypothetical protein
MGSKKRGDDPHSGPWILFASYPKGPLNESNSKNPVYLKGLLLLILQGVELLQLAPVLRLYSAQGKKTLKETSPGKLE